MGMSNFRPYSFAASLAIYFLIPTSPTSGFQFTSSRSPRVTRGLTLSLQRIRNEDASRPWIEPQVFSGYSIQVADSRESVFEIDLYRFGGKTLDEHIEASQEPISREDMLRWLTRFCDDDGKQKVYYGNGGIGESVQFFAQASGVSSSFSAGRKDVDGSHEITPNFSCILGSVEVVKEPKSDEVCDRFISFELKNLSVHKIARRRGIGKALTLAVQEYARSQTSILENQQHGKVECTVHLIVERQNEGAMRLYKETGFVCDDDDTDPLCEMKWMV